MATVTEDSRSQGVVRRRGLERSMFSRLLTQAEALLGAEPVDNAEIEALLERLRARSEILTSLDEEVVREMMDSERTGEELLADMERSEEYALRYQRLVRSYASFKTKCRDVQDGTGATGRLSPCRGQSFPLGANLSDNINAEEQVTPDVGQSGLVPPRIPHSSPDPLLQPVIAPSYKSQLTPLGPPKFSGEIKDWVFFWGKFLIIHEDPNIDELDKFQYLLAAMPPNSRARAIVETFPPSRNNYKKAIDSLKNRFGREDVLIDLHVRELLKLVTQKGLSLTDMYDKLETQLRILETLNLNSDRFAAMLVPIVESSLPSDVLRTWQRTAGAADPSVGDSAKARLESIMSFLRSEVENEERVSMASKGFSKCDVISKSQSLRIKEKDKLRPTSSDLINIKGRNYLKCVFCDAAHENDKCLKARELSFDQRKERLQAHRLCFSCMKKHKFFGKCKAASPCLLCGKGNHVILMCPKFNNLSMSHNNNNNETREATLSSVISESVILLTIKVFLRAEDDRERVVRCLLDSGSQRSYITKSIAKQMQYRPLRTEVLTHGLFGGTESSRISHSVYSIRLRSLDKSYACRFEALDQEQICSSVPRIPDGPWFKELKDEGVWLPRDRGGPIDVLIGADILGKLLTGRRVLLSSGLVALETLLGWTLMGKLSHPSTSLSYMNVASLLSLESSISSLWELDAIGIEAPEVKLNKQQATGAALKFFRDTVSINPEGRYEVRMPWLSDHLPVPRNFNIAEKRLWSTVGKLTKLDALENYSDVFKDWKRQGIIEDVPLDNWDKGHYLPHRAVFKENSTTKIRPVFDASAREKGYPSLNQCLNKGVNFIEQIPPLLIRFRLEEIGVISDIQQAFLQIAIAEDERDFFRFLWINDEGNLKIFRHARVVFGITSSPFHLMATIYFHLNSIIEDIKNSKLSVPIEIPSKLLKSFYVDNCVTSLRPSELYSFIQQSTKIFSLAHMNLRRWEYTDSSLPEPRKTSVLGLNWERKNDILTVNLDSISKVDCEVVTRRVILSVAHRLFDPIGFTCPVSLVPKLILRQIHNYKLNWDSEVPTPIANNFRLWLKSLNKLEALAVPRWFQSCGGQMISRSLHVFCDASKDAYAVAIFLRIETTVGVCSYLVGAKSRVAPLNPKMSIPRLELMAATIGARLAADIRKELDMYNITQFNWSDSSTVIAWITKDEPWGVFVYNRVKEIRENTSLISWRHIAGKQNPADLPSRGCSAAHLVDSKWWEGPRWLLESPDSWPTLDIVSFNEEEVSSEIRKTHVSSALSTNWYYHKFSKFVQIVRLIGWIKRFIFNCLCRKRGLDRRIGNLFVLEINLAEKEVIKLIQKDSFKGLNDPLILHLSPFYDDKGIIRITSKISNRKDSYQFRFPALLPSKHPVVHRLVLDYHTRLGHVGVQCLLTLLREEFWIIKGRQSVRSIISKCTLCKKYKAKSIVVPTPALPEPRVRDSKVFEVCGIDFVGPLYVREGGKVWICLFTCAVYRCIHLEVVTSLSTESFVLAFKRFIARRGRPSIVYCDNGSNFVGTVRAIDILDWEKIGNDFAIEKIDWRFSPPSAPWWGGFFERMVGLVKGVLRKTIGRSSLSVEELGTVLCDCEAIVNSRPLTHVSEDPNDLQPLTPAMFLQEVLEVRTPDLDSLETGKSLRKRLKYLSEVKEHLRQRFRSEYLGQLKAKSRRANYNLRKGELVMVKDDQCKRTFWPLALVEDLFPGTDGECRVARLKTASGLLHRPVRNLFPLELSLEEGQRSTEEELRRIASTVGV